MTLVVVTFTETVTRTLSFNLDLGEWEPEALEVSDIHEMLDRQNAWDQPAREAWLSGDVEVRNVDEFEIPV